MNDGANAIAHLGERGSRISQSAGVIEDLCLGSKGQLTGAKKRVERVHQAGNAGVGGVALGHPRAEVEHNSTATVVKAAEAVGIARVAEQAAFKKVHLKSHGRVRGQLEFGRCGAGSSEGPRELVTREEEVKDCG